MALATAQERVACLHKDRFDTGRNTSCMLRDICMHQESDQEVDCRNKIHGASPKDRPADWSKRVSHLPAARPRVHMSQAMTNSFFSPRPACVIAAVILPRSFIPWRPLGMVFTRMLIFSEAFSPCKESCQTMVVKSRVAFLGR